MPCVCGCTEGAQVNIAAVSAPESGQPPGEARVWECPSCKGEIREASLTWPYRCPHCGADFTRDYWPLKKTEAVAAPESGRARIEAKLYMYWCPVCKVGTGDRSWHSVGRAGLIPQTQDEHECERIDVSALLADLAASEQAREEAQAEADRRRHYMECADTPLMRDVLAERARAVQALSDYGVHKIACDITRAIGIGRVISLPDCTCGFDVIRAALAVGGAHPDGEQKGQP